MVYLPREGSFETDGGITVPFISPVSVSAAIDGELLCFVIFCPNQCSQFPAPVNSWCSKNGGLKSQDSAYVPFWQKLENCGACSLLLPTLSKLQRIALQYWSFSDISLTYNYCKTLK